MNRILLIEDDAQIRTLVVKGLREVGFVVSSAASGMTGLQAAIDESPDVVLLDLGLPDVDGTQVLSMLRAISTVPVIITTARDDDPSLVAALNDGADDYVVKPFSLPQLEARIRAVLRRVSDGSAAHPVVVVGGLRLDIAGHNATLDGTSLELTAREFDLLAYLAERVGQVVTKKELLAQVWQQPWGGADKTVDVHLSWLRRKLGESAAEPRYLTTIRGVGVKLSDPEQSR